MRRTAMTAIAALVLAAAPARAQVLGLPVYNSGVTSGISLNADYGFVSVDPGSAKAKTLGLTGGLALGPLGVTATYASLNPETGDNQSSVGATANLKVFGGPLIPISVNAQLGLGYWQDKDFFGPGLDRKNVNIPVGLGIALNVPTPGLSIKPWIAPRMQYTRTSGNVDDSQTNFGISAGVNLGLVGGINGRFAYDQITYDVGATEVKSKVFSVGLGFNFNIPVVPGI
ncbi:MAG: outer membrane beta-barrel protein [Gemmatimonadota bacterium]